MQMRIIIGMAIGITLTMFYPDIIPYIKDAFIESGVRDATIETLQNVR